jgi:hypothetical protein
MKALNVITLIIIAVILSATPAVAIERTITGRLAGINCILVADLCAIDNRDPHIALELDFVLFLEKGDHYLLTNVPREVKIQFYGKNIEVTGDAKEEYRAITVEILKVKEGGRYKKVWTPQAEARDWKEWRRRFYEQGSEN